MNQNLSFKSCFLFTLITSTGPFACAPVRMQSNSEHSLWREHTEHSPALSKRPEEKIIGVSDLQPVAPRSENLPAELRSLTSAIGQLNIGCTATHIGKGLVLTAGHCISSSPRSSSVSCRLLAVIWGNIGSEPNKPLTTSKCLKMFARSSSAESDFALLLVENPPQAAIALDSRELSGPHHLNVTMLSFPRMRPMEWSGFCELLPYSGEFPSLRKFFHSCDSEGGSSGAPIIALDSLSVVGIHGGAADEFNYGTFSAVVNAHIPRATQDDSH